MATRVGVTAARAAAIACMASTPLSALALGLGELQMQSFLNEPLQAELTILDTRELTADDIRIRLAGIDEFERLGVDRSYFLTSIEFEIDLDPSTGRGVIRLTTEDAVLEPYLNLVVEARWPNGRVLREYTVLVDPPAFRAETITVSAAERVREENPDKPAVAPQERRAPSTDASAQSRVEARGDRVAVRESSLPPGTMPDRAFSAETVETPRAGSRYMVKRDETLWQIASRGRPDDISVQQAMLDIQRVNPEAFIDGNINRIKAGYIIYLPAAGEVASNDLAQALDEVRAQNRAFEDQRATPGVTAAASLRVSADTAPATARAEADPGTVGAAMEMSDEQADTAGEAADSVASVDPAEPPPAVVAGDAGDNDRVATQLAAMADRLDTLEQIVSLKDEQIASLEQALQEAREEAAAAAVRPAPAAPAPAPTPAPTGPAAGAAFPWMPMAGGLVAVLLGVAFFLRRRRATESEAPLGAGSGATAADADVFAGVSLKKEALSEAPDVPEAAATAPAPGVPAEKDAPKGGKDSLSRGGSRGYGESKNDDYIDDGHGGDALAEADIYIAYGRYLQAVELLNTAITAEPENSAYRLKLIELYVDMGEEGSAGEQLQALKTYGDADAIARAESLLGTGGSAESSLGSPEPVAVGRVDEEAPGPGDGAAEAAESVDEDPFGAIDAGDLGLEIDEPEPEPEPTAPPLPAGPTPGTGTLTDEFDLADFEDGADALATDEDALDLDLVPEADPVPAEGAVTLDLAPEFDDLEIESPGPEGDEPAARVSEPEEVLDLTDALADFEGKDLEGDAEDEIGDEFMIADDADQMATKLDLARAYLDMGDSEGARTILEEVAADGGDDLQQEARDLLARIG